MLQKKPAFGVLAAVVVAVMAAALVTAQESDNAADKFTFALTGAEEVPPNDAVGTGLAKVMIVGDKLKVDVSFDGLTGPLTGAHIHAPALPGENASVAFNIIPGELPAGSESPLRAMFSITEAQKEIIRSGRSYLNLHTATYPGGEIRGQIPAEPAPEAKK